MRIYKVVMISDRLDRHGSPLAVLMGTIHSHGMPKNTHDYVAYQNLAELFGFRVQVMTSSFYDALQTQHTMSYEEVHKPLWARLRKRGEVLKLRRKDKRNGR